MVNFVTLSCPTCGGKLRITEGIDRFACAHCGNEHIVERGGGIVSIVPLLGELSDLKTGVDKTTSELAIARLEKQQETIRTKIINLQTSKSKVKSERTKISALIAIKLLVDIFLTIFAFIFLKFEANYLVILIFVLPALCMVIWIAFDIKHIKQNVSKLAKYDSTIEELINKYSDIRLEKDEHQIIVDG
jgi:hypothetical protein